MTPAVPLFEMQLPADKAKGVQLFSLVGNPATGIEWVRLAADEAPTPLPLKLSAANAPMQQVVTGPALIPGQVIYRLDAATQKPYHITFKTDTVAAASRRFLGSVGLTLKSNQDHATPLEGNTVIESWLVTDTANDKAYALGYTPEQIPAGTWMVSMHVADSDFWNSKVLTGELTGLSLEGEFEAELTAALSAITPPMTETEKATEQGWFKALLSVLKTELGIEAKPADTPPAAPPADPAPVPEPEPAAVAELKAQLSAVTTENVALKLAETERDTLKTQLAAVTAERDEKAAEAVRLAAELVEVKAKTPAAKPISLASDGKPVGNDKPWRVLLTAKD